MIQHESPIPTAGRFGIIRNPFNGLWGTVEIVTPGGEYITHPNHSTLTYKAASQEAQRLHHRGLTDAEKREKYAAGKWQSPPPPVCTLQWDAESWIKFIDRDGRWID